MGKQEKKIRIYSAISEEESNEQEKFGGFGVNKNKRIIEMNYSEIESQLNENIFPLINNINLPTEENNSSLKLSKITLKLGFSLEGNIFIASGKVESALELEFTK